MKAPLIPENESERLKSLHELNILDTPDEERFNQITRLAAHALDVDQAAISLIDEDRQWFKSCTAQDLRETSRTTAFCSHAILKTDPTVVPDAREDERFEDNPLVTGEPHIRFYASIPIRAPDGHKVGTLCVFDPEPGDLSLKEQEIMEDLAGLVERELQIDKMNNVHSKLVNELEAAEKMAATDSLTGLWNRGAIEELLHREIERANREDNSLSIAMMDLDNFKSINDDYGHMVGDRILEEVSNRIQKSIRPYDEAGRYGGEEFLMVFTNTKHQQGLDIIQRLQSKLQSNRIEVDQNRIKPTASVGLAELRSGEDQDELIDRSDRYLYCAKHNGRNCIGLAKNVDFS